MHLRTVLLFFVCSFFSDLSARDVAKRKIARSQQNSTLFRSLSNNPLIKSRQSRAVPMIIPLIAGGIATGFSSGVGLTLWEQISKLLFPDSPVPDESLPKANPDSNHCREINELTNSYININLLLNGVGASFIGWTCIEWDHGYLKLRKNSDGDIQCGGLTQNSCIIDAKNQQECTELIPTTTLSCGAEHKKIYGHSGYDADGHWCNTDLTPKPMPWPKGVSRKQDCQQFKDGIIEQAALLKKQFWPMEILAHSEKLARYNYETFGYIYFELFADGNTNLDALLCNSGRSSLEWWLKNERHWSQNEAVKIRKEFVAKMKDFLLAMETFLDKARYWAKYHQIYTGGRYFLEILPALKDCEPF